jgi:hypothetical protein
MNWDRIKGNLEHLNQHSNKPRMSMLNEEQLDEVTGKRNLHIGKLMESYGVSDEQIEKEFSDWQKMHTDYE